MSRQIVTPEQIQRAKSIVEYAAVESLETEEIVLLGWAIQAIAAKEAEIEALRSELESTRKGWKDLAEAPHKHQGMMVSLRGFVLRVSEYLDRKDQGGDAFVLREIQRNLCEVWNRRGDPRIVAEFGALYCLDKDGPIEEVEDDDDKGDKS